MATDPREIFVNSQYPIPPFVDGITRVAEEVDPEDSSVFEVTDLDESVSIEESDGEDEQIQVPTPISVTDQNVVPARGGGSEVQAILNIEEVPYISDYEIRVVMR